MATIGSIIDAVKRKKHTPFQAYHFATGSEPKFATFDEAVAWAIDKTHYSVDCYDNYVGIYNKDLEKENPSMGDIARVSRECVVVNEGHGTAAWPDGSNPEGN